VRLLNPPRSGYERSHSDCQCSLRLFSISQRIRFDRKMRPKYRPSGNHVPYGAKNTLQIEKYFLRLWSAMMKRKCPECEQTNAHCARIAADAAAVSAQRIPS